MVDQDQETEDNCRRQYQQDYQRIEWQKEPYNHTNEYGDTK